MADEGAREKWDRRYTEGCAGDLAPAGVLFEYAYLLPDSGTALDLACGRGGNALFLARRGFKVHAWDISKAAIEGLDRQARSEGLEIEARVCDVIESPPSSNTFDVICVSYYLERSIAGHIIEALKPKGILSIRRSSTRRSPMRVLPIQPTGLGQTSCLNCFHRYTYWLMRNWGVSEIQDRGCGTAPGWWRKNVKNWSWPQDHYRKSSHTKSC